MLKGEKMLRLIIIVPIFFLCTVIFAGIIPTGKGIGLQGEYYNGREFAEPALTIRSDSIIDFSYSGNDELLPGKLNNNFCVRWTGRIMPRYSELYTFSTMTDDGIRLWVDNNILINNWTDHGGTEDNGTINLDAGKLYDIKIEFFQGGGGGCMQLYWSSASQEKEIIPQNQLYPLAFRGKTFVYTDNNDIRKSSVYLKNEKNTKKILDTCNAEPSLSVNGDKIAYINTDKISWDDPNVLKNTDIYILNIESNEIKKLPHPGYEDRRPVFSHDGKKIAFVCKNIGKWQIWRMNTDGGKLTTIVKNEYDNDCPVFSADGTKIIFQSKRDDKWNIYSVLLNGSEEVQLTTDGGIEPATTIYYDLICFINQGALFTMNMEGKDIKRITAENKDAEYSHPVINIDGRSIAAIKKTNEKSEIVIIDLKKLKEETLPIEGNAYYLSWSL